MKELINKAKNDLADSGTNKHYQQMFKRVCKQLLIYADNKKITSFSVDFGLEFLEKHYSMSKKVSENKWNCVVSFWGCYLYEAGTGTKSYDGKYDYETSFGIKLD